MLDRSKLDVFSREKGRLRYDANYLSLLPLRESDIAFLTSLSLTKKYEFLSDSMCGFRKELSVIEMGDISLIDIGDFVGRSLYLSSTGTVYSSPSYGYPSDAYEDLDDLCYLNSSIEKFLDFVTACISVFNDPDRSASGSKRIIEVIKRWYEIEPFAVKNSAYWAAVVQDWELNFDIDLTDTLEQ